MANYELSWKNIPEYTKLVTEHDYIQVERYGTLNWDVEVYPFDSFANNYVKPGKATIFTPNTTSRYVLHDENVIEAINQGVYGILPLPVSYTTADGTVISKNVNCVLSDYEVNPNIKTELNKFGFTFNVQAGHVDPALVEDRTQGGASTIEGSDGSELNFLWDGTGNNKINIPQNYGTTLATPFEWECDITTTGGHGIIEVYVDDTLVETITTSGTHHIDEVVSHMFEHGNNGTVDLWRTTISNYSTSPSPYKDWKIMDLVFKYDDSTQTLSFYVAYTGIAYGQNPPTYFKVKKRDGVDNAWCPITNVNATLYKRNRTTTL